jgi:hypothetical protein
MPLLETIPDIEEPSSGVFGAIIDACREQGFEQGYEKARRESLSALIPLAETVILPRPPV